MLFRIRSWRDAFFILAFILFGCFTSAASALADEITAKSVIESVTVFPVGAEITRSLTVKLDANEHTVMLRLPKELERNSIRVEVIPKNTDVAISAVGLRAVPPAADIVDPAGDEVQQQIEDLKAKRVAIDRTIEDAGFLRQLMATLAQRKLQPQGLDTLPVVPSSDKLSSLLDLVSGRLNQVSETVLEAQAKQREIDKEIRELKRRAEQMARPTKNYSEVSVHVASRKAMNVTLHLSYRLAKASWKPMYEARLWTEGIGKSARLSLIQNAEVVQATSESWDDVTLKLSTVQPTGATSAPNLSVQELGAYVRSRSDRQGRTTTQSGLDKKPEMGAAAVDKMQATAFKAGFHGLYAIPGRVTIDNSGMSKNVRIRSQDVDAELSLKAVPKLNLTAFFNARFSITGELPLLPGPVMLFRDAVFVGEGMLPQLSPGEAFNLGFGVDDLVRVERRKTLHKSGETGLISSAIIDERSYLTKITSWHSRPIPITIIDQVPYATEDRIRVELLPGTTSPTQRDVDGKRGIYAWTMTLKPKSRNEVRFGFRVTWPRDMTR